MIQLVHLIQARNTTAFCTFLLLILSVFPAVLLDVQKQYANAWLAADTVVVSTNKWTHEAARSAKSMSFKTATMLAYQDQFILTHLQLLDHQYPVKGALKLTYGETLKAGQVYIDRSLAERMSIEIGDQVEIGYLTCEVVDFVVSQDEQVFSVEAFSEGVYGSIDDLERFGIFNNASRGSWYYYYDASEGISIEETAQKDGQVRVIDSNERLGRLGRIYQQAQDTVGSLQIAISLIIGAALYLSYSLVHQRNAYLSGVLTALGFSFKKRTILMIQPIIFSLLQGVFFGLVLGLLVLNILLKMSDVSFSWGNQFELASTTSLIILLYAVALLCTQHVSMQRSPVLSLLKKKCFKDNYWVSGVLILTVTAYFIPGWEQGTVWLGLLSVTTVFLIIYLSVHVLYKLGVWLLSKGRQRGLIVLNALRQFEQDYKVLLIGLILLQSVLLFLWHVNTQTLNQWRSQLPSDSPNYFLIGMDQSDAVDMQKYEWFADTVVYPVVKGRMVAVNSESVAEYADGLYAGHEVFNRQINLTTFTQLPSHNQLIEGDLDNGISAEQGIMDRLGLKIGDVLTFDIMGASISYPITSVRQVKWQSLQASFYFVFPSFVLEPYPKTYMSSLYIDKSRQSGLIDVLKARPHISLIDLAAYLVAAQNLLHIFTSLLLGVVIFMGQGCFVIAVILLIRQVESRKIDEQSLKRLGVNSKYSMLIEFSSLLGISLLLTIGINQFLLLRYFNIIFFQWTLDLWGVALLVGFDVLVIAMVAWYSNKYLKD
ncbi:hypothetical protein MMH89_01950 [Candidatus Comchoanobacter bicostacola]|uniref:FtsX-like permease family protein n=1 Tax=Candidatus Comchoanobacter bicostacola TaxID=2919598 RepID=A0ABY5DMP5_9GAMM|nr:hypothetical protein [Candidatus Comchoanobacter bicostacola]UTC24911.1 hypothetical protein MMH89_01950 [Candidatus Comchoanobacter bicostacola]